MHISLLLLVVVVVAVAAPPTFAAPRSYFDDGSGVSRPWMGPRPMNPPHPMFSPSGGDDYLGGLGQYGHSNFRRSPMDDFTRRLMEVQRRCPEELVLRCLLQEQGHPLRGQQQDFPWFYPTFHVPYLPAPDKDEKDVEQKPTLSDEFPLQEDNFDDTDEGDETSIFLDFLNPGPQWHILPYLPKVPDANELPDSYDNATHEVYIVNGSRVEVNTTTNKKTNGSITTFFHTEIIYILPDETPEEGEETTESTLTTDEDTTEEPVPSDGTLHEEDESTTTKSPEEPPVEEETENELPRFDHAVPAEMVKHEVSMP